MSNAAYRFNNDLRRRPEDHPNQTQFTPSYVLEPVREDLGGRIELDPCTVEDNPVGADRFYALPQDGKELPWNAATIFVNPPYGEARGRWVERCIEAGQAGSRVILLIPAHTDTRIFQRALATVTAVVLIKGRVKFGVHRPNGRQVAASHPSALLAWGTPLSHSRHLGTSLSRIENEEASRV